MSLINQMLQDLDKRKSPDAGAVDLPSGVRAAAVETAPSRARLRPAVVVLAAVGLCAAAGFYIWGEQLGGSSAPVAAQAQPITPLPGAQAVAVPTPDAATAEAAATPAAVPVTAKTEPPVPTEAKVEPVPAPIKTVKVEPEAAKVSKGNAPANPVGGVPSKAAAEPVAPGVDKLPPLAKNAPVSKSSSRSENQLGADARYRQALDAYSQGRTTESLAQAREALNLDPDHLDARQLLLRQLVEQREMEQARVVARQGLTRHPEQMAWVKLLLRLELEKGDFAAARAVIEQAPPAATAHPDFQSLAGMVAQRQGRYADAAEHYRAALTRNGNDGRAWIGLALALEAQGHEPEAREAFKRALAIEGLPAELQALAQKKTR